MQNLSISEIKQSPQSTITGYLFIKKNLFWSERYIRMGEGKLSYYQQKSDKIPKGILILKNAQVIQKYDGKPQVIQIKAKHGTIPSILIKIQQANFRSKVIKCLNENIKSEFNSQKQMKDLSFEDLQTQQMQSQYPPLPEVYKNNFNRKFYLQKEQNEGLIFSQSPQKKSPTSSQSRHDYQLFFAGLIMGLLLSLGWFCFLVGIVLLAFVGSLISLSKKRMSKLQMTKMIRKQKILHIPIDQIFRIIQNLRNQMYVYEQVKFIMNDQQFYQEESKFYLIEKDINKPRYFWQFIHNQDKTLVSIMYAPNNPSVSLSTIPHLALKLKTIHTQSNIKDSRKSINITSEGKSFMNSYNRSQSTLSIIPTKQVSAELQESTIQKTQNKSNQFLPALNDMLVLYPKVPKVLLEECVESRKKFLQTINMKYDKTQVKNLCFMSVRQMEGGLLVTKGTTTLKGNVDDIVKYVRDLSKRGEYDGMFNSGKLIQQYEICGILHQKFNGMFPVSARDFVLLLSVEKIENGVMIHGKSTKYLEYPPDNKTVRGQVLSAGFLIKDVGDGNVQVTYLTYSDPAGDLPGIIKKKAGAMQSGVIMKLRQKLQKKSKNQ